MKVDLLRATAAELQQLLIIEELTSVELVRKCHEQMLHHNSRLKAVISISPLSYTISIAERLDEERRDGMLRSPLHGIPFIVKVSMTTSKTM